MKTIEYSQHVINTCLKLRYQFEVKFKQDCPLEHNFIAKSHMWKLFLDEKLRTCKINKHIHDVCLEEFLNPKDLTTKEEIRERIRAKRVKENEQ